MNKLFLLLSFLLLQNRLHAEALQFGFYGIKKHTKELCFIDTLGRVTVIGNTNLPDYIYVYHQMDVNPVTHELYVIGKGDSIYTLSTQTGKSTYKFQLKVAFIKMACFTGISFNSKGELYAFRELVGYEPGKLYKVTDLTTGACRPVSTSYNSGMATILGMEFDAANVLWAADECCMNRLHQMDTASGKCISNSIDRLHIDTPTELDFSNGIMYGIAVGEEGQGHKTSFFKIDLKTGTTHILFILDDVYLSIAGGYHYMPPPVWQRWWFVIAMGAGCVLISLLVIKWRVSYIKKREEKKTALNKKMAELELKALKARINPHFLFNTMSAIQHYVVKNNPDKAYEYFSKYTLLMRRIFDHSSVHSITVEEELDTLKIYLELESLRMENGFEYSITVDDTIDQSFEKIPPLLIQPYVENAIWHGLAHKPGGKGCISIHLSRHDDSTFFCTVEDNGVGRAASGRLKSKNMTGHKSSGMAVTNERITLLNTMAGSKFPLNIIDLMDDATNPAGTRVELFIPLQSS